MQEASADNAPDSKASLPWHRTVVGKVAIFMLMGVIFAYLMGGCWASPWLSAAPGISGGAKRK